MTEYNWFDHIGYTIGIGTIVLALVHAFIGLASWLPVAVSILSPAGLVLAGAFGGEVDDNGVPYPFWGAALALGLVVFGYGLLLVAPLLSQAYSFVVTRAVVLLVLGLLFVLAIDEANERINDVQDTDQTDHSTDLDPDQIEVAE